MCKRKEVGGWGGSSGVSLTTLRPDRINYSDVSICHLLLVAQPEHPQTPTGLEGKGRSQILKEKVIMGREDKTKGDMWEGKGEEGWQAASPWRWMRRQGGLRESS